MSVEEKISKELAARKKRGKSAILPEFEGVKDYEPHGVLKLLTFAQNECFHLQKRSDSWALGSIGIIALITMFAFLGLWPKADAGWLARVVWKLILAGSIGAIALFFSRTQERIQKRVSELVGMINDWLMEMGERYSPFKLAPDFFESDSLTKILFMKAAAAVAAVSIVFII